MNKLNKKVSNQGFTLIEILVVIGIIAVLAAVVLIAINPARQFAQARDSQRTANVNAILNAIGQNMADNAGRFCPDDTTGDEFALPTSADQYMGSDDEVDLADCLVPDYIPALPFDPTIEDGWTSVTDYETGYTVQVVDGSRIEVCADEEESALERTEPICVTR